MGFPHDRHPTQGQSQSQWPPVPSPTRNVVYLPYPPAAFPWFGVPCVYPQPMQIPVQSIRPQRDTLHPCIDGGRVPLLFDVRENPRCALPEYARFAGFSVFPEPVRDLRLVARAFPWPIEIRNEVVMCGTIWERAHAALRRPVAEAEWALVCLDPAKKRTVERAMKRRVDRDPAEEKSPLRVDYLGDETMFMGLEKGEEFVESVLLPGKRKVETWVIKMGRR